jgi:hypothetical protein
MFYIIAQDQVGKMIGEDKVIDLEKYIKAANKVISNDSDDLLTKENEKTKPKGNKHWGKCYIASESMYFHLGGKKSGFKPMNMKHEGRSHWFLRSPSHEVIDLTGEQYTTMPDYKIAVGRGFLPTINGISKRSMEFYRRVMKVYGSPKTLNLVE